MTEEEDFRKENPGFLRRKEFDSLTVRAYETETHFFLFGKFDGHLAFRMKKGTKEIEFECECIKRGRERIFGSK